MTRFRWTLLFITLAIAASVLLLEGASRHVAIASLILTLIALVSMGVPLIGMRFFGPAIVRGSGNGKRVALTFDDGPDPAATPALLELLRRENVKATFFLIGRRVEAHPEIALRIAEEGHLIGNHSQNHRWSNTFTGPAAIAREMTDAQDAIERATGVVPRFYRPPVGLTTPHYYTALRRVGLRLVGWNVRPFDTINAPGVVVERVLRWVGPGSIILLHDASSPPGKIVEIVEALIPALRARGFELARVDEML